MSQGRRGAPARLGLSALNLLWPGLGLLRARADSRTALLLAAPILLLGLVCAVYALGPTLGFAGWATIVIAAAVIYVGLIIAAIILTWRTSADRQSPPPFWSRWYAIVLVWIVLVAATTIVDVRRFYRLYRVRSEAMMPTILKNDRFVARMRNFGELRRGDVVIVRVARFDYVERIAALGGDRIRLEAGEVFLNGARVPQRPVGEEQVAGQPVRRLAERFPGERREHHIYDLGPTEADDFPETLVPPGHVFVLGDNRDMSADSRVPREQSGVALARVGDVIGRALFFSWWPGMAHSGQPIAD